jgi:molybdopterin/thiamine biosynthesis adenylyltransferase
MTPMKSPELTDEERAVYEWQMLLPNFGDTAQRRLKAASVLISRVGGVGGAVALQLAAAGIGRLVLAHAGDLKPSDLNRQLLQRHARIGLPRMDSILEQLKALNPRLEVVAVRENVSADNASDLVRQADVVVDAAPLFAERFALNRAAVQQRKPMVESAMYAFEAQLTTILPGTTPCLRCFVREAPAHWTRKFPVLGAVSGTVGCMAAVEVVKLLTGVGKTLAGVLLSMDLGTMEFRRLKIARATDCPECAGLGRFPGAVADE